MPFAQPGNDNIREVGGNPTPADMFKALPVVTRYWFGATLVVTASASFKIINPIQMVWIWEAAKNKLELWRFLTPFCFAGNFSMSTLFVLYMQVSFSKQYETGIPFNTGAGGGTADYAFCLLLGAIGILLTYPVLVSMGVYLQPFFMENLCHYVLYVWSKKNPNNQSNIWGFPVQGIYLPFAYLGLTVLMGKPFEGLLHGMALGHLYYFVVDVIPLVYGKDFLRTPAFLIDYFGVGDYQPPEAPQAAPRTGGFAGSNRTGAAAAPTHNWGSGGNRLGTN
mmetsp:Transcript_19028/g.39080  ORF Transcript_19028/g.39080 Transcript_19028/m.39080 type:complete len:279 (+) Transcript_19028:188-1024(+)|eukprot:CAMPEP_0201129772 /NCGR_PEP_ID=MMETSP0850-20130426/38014_1 /ASSEMBLY_ACC=CAM_ASM_000622 /TAXON_ID=183588 /ORGANISM="Pseudo-nitzschia fraudulenta, Strain WWA7" /LENGTH=278 /DNA_ID=CAMNT_0047399349 /DNA_START=171 /DNA_END=1010 /DNA_ORIENTATION=-